MHGDDCIGLHCFVAANCHQSMACVQTRSVSLAMSVVVLICSAFYLRTVSRSGKCRASPDCVGRYCSITSDCEKLEFCCGGTCSKEECPIYDKFTLFNIMLIVGAIVFSCAVSLLLHFVCRRQRSAPAHGRAISEQREPMLLLRYEEQQMTKPPPYNSGTTKASEQPPPYIAAPQGRSGGMNTSLNAYIWCCFKSISVPCITTLICKAGWQEFKMLHLLKDN